jgi:hypothetical protein
MVIGAVYTTIEHLPVGVRTKEHAISQSSGLRLTVYISTQFSPPIVSRLAVRIASAKPVFRPCASRLIGDPEFFRNFGLALCDCTPDFVHTLRPSTTGAHLASWLFNIYSWGGIEIINHRHVLSPEVYQRRSRQRPWYPLKPQRQTARGFTLNCPNPPWTPGG